MEQVDVNNQLKTYMGDVLMNVMSSNPQILEKNNKEKWKLDVLFKWILLNWEYIRRFIYISSMVFLIEYCITYSLNSYKTEKHLQNARKLKDLSQGGWVFLLQHIWHHVLGSSLKIHFVMKMLTTSEGHRLFSVKELWEGTKMQISNHLNMKIRSGD